MNYDPVKYLRFERMPVGCFSAEMTANGWANTKFNHDLQEHLFSGEVSEFVRLVHHFFKDNADWQKLQKFAGKYCTEIRDEFGNPISAVNYLGDELDYTLHINGTTVNIFPYRKSQHINLGVYA